MRVISVLLEFPTDPWSISIEKPSCEELLGLCGAEPTAPSMLLSRHRRGESGGTTRTAEAIMASGVGVSGISIAWVTALGARCCVPLCG